MNRPILKLKLGASTEQAVDPDPVPAEVKGEARQPPKDRTAAKAAFYELFPQLLEYKPLAVGIAAILKPVFTAAGWSANDFRYAIEAHSKSECYLRGLLQAGAPRYGANGKPQGVVSESGAKSAVQRLRKKVRK